MNKQYIQTQSDYLENPGQNGSKIEELIILAQEVNVDYNTRIIQFTSHT